MEVQNPLSSSKPELPICLLLGARKRRVETSGSKVLFVRLGNTVRVVESPGPRWRWQDHLGSSPGAQVCPWPAGEQPGSDPAPNCKPAPASSFCFEDLQVLCPVLELKSSRFKRCPCLSPGSSHRSQGGLRGSCRQGGRVPQDAAKRVIRTRGRDGHVPRGACAVSRCRTYGSIPGGN